MKKIKPAEMVHLIVSRKTHGMAFNPPPEGYQTAREKIRVEVQRDYDNLSLAEFKLKYEIWIG